MIKNLKNRLGKVLFSIFFGAKFFSVGFFRRLNTIEKDKKKN